MLALVGKLALLNCTWIVQILHPVSPILYKYLVQQRRQGILTEVKVIEILQILMRVGHHPSLFLK